MALRELSFELTFDSQIKKIREANTAFDKMEQEAKQAGNSVSNLEDKSKKLGNSFRGLKTLAAGVFAGLSLKAGFNFFVQGNADMETYRNTLNIVMKDTAKANEALQWATNFAAKTPFEVPGIVEATTRLTTYGIEAQKTLPIIGDMASTMGKDIMQAVEAVADAQTGELERLKEFGITKGMLQEQADAMGIVFQNNKGQITSFENLNTALFALMEDRYKGAMQIQSNTFKGMVSNAQDMIGNIGRTVGKPIFDAISEQMKGLLEIGNELAENGTIERWADNVASGLEKLGNFARGVGDAFGWAKQNADVLAPILGAIGISIFTLVIPSIVAWTYATVAQAAAQWALIAPMLATVAPILAVGAVIGGLIWIWKNYGDAIKTYVTQAWVNIQTQFNQIKTFLSGINLFEIGANIIRGLVNGMASMLGKAKEIASNIGNNIASTFKSFFGIQSPSKLMFQYGGYIGEGLDLGMQSKTQNLEATGQTMAQATEGEFVNNTSSTSNSFAPSINITVNGSGGGARETASSVRREVESVLSAYEKKMMLRWGTV